MEVDIASVEEVHETKIADEFLRAAIGAGSWLKALEGVADLTHAARAQLVGVNKSKIVVFHYITEMDRRAFADFNRINGDDPLISPRWAVVEKAPELSVVGDIEYEQTHSKLKNLDYLDYAKRWDIPYGTQSTIIKTPELYVFLNSLRSNADGRSDEVSRNALARIAPKVRSAVQLAQNLENQGGKLLSSAFDAMAKPAFICGNDGKIISFTNTAEKILSAAKLLKIENGVLKSTLAMNQSSLEKSIKTALETNRSQTVVLKPASDLHDALILDINILPHHDWDFSILPKLIITIRTPAQQFSTQTLAQMFDFSQTESQIAALFAQGKSRQEIAALRGVSIETIRAQFKSIFAKTGVNREIELMAKLR